MKNVSTTVSNEVAWAGPLSLGGGAELVLACDLVVASTTARFALPESRRGIIATSGGLFRGPRALPRNLATDLLLAGGELDAHRAFDVGFVNWVSAPGEAVVDALALAGEVCRSSPVTIARDAPCPECLDDEDELGGCQQTEAAADRVRRSSDYREGIAAYFERGDPVWTGR